jgi:hypothetical protein
MHAKLHLGMKAAQHCVVTSHGKDDVELAARLLIAGIEVKGLRAQIGVVQELAVVVSEP